MRYYFFSQDVKEPNLGRYGLVACCPHYLFWKFRKTAIHFRITEAGIVAVHEGALAYTEQHPLFGQLCTITIIKSYHRCRTLFNVCFR